MRNVRAVMPYSSLMTTYALGVELCWFGCTHMLLTSQSGTCSSANLALALGVLVWFGLSSTVPSLMMTGVPDGAWCDGLTLSRAACTSTVPLAVRMTWTV